MDELLVDQPTYRVRKSIISEDPVYVCFDHWRPKQDIDGPFFGLSFLQSQGRNVISIKSGANDWFQHDDFDEVVSRIDEAAGNRPRIGYGSSMGAYAALNFSSRLKLSKVVLFAPQSTVDPAKVPWERRFAADQDRIAFRYDVVASIPAVESGFVVFDPYEVHDARHAAAIRARHALSAIHVPFAGHEVLDWFARNGTIRRTVAALLFEDEPWRAVTETRKVQRGSSAVWWLNLARHLLAKGRYGKAVAAADQACRLAGGGSVIARHVRAKALYLDGDVARAMEYWREDGGTASETSQKRWLMKQEVGRHAWPELRELVA